jgi:hypothetical protein
MTLPAESNTVTCTGGWMMLSLIASCGCTVNASLGEAGAGGAWLPSGVLVKSLSK